MALRRVLELAFKDFIFLLAFFLLIPPRPWLAGVVLPLPSIDGNPVTGLGG